MTELERRRDEQMKHWLIAMKRASNNEWWDLFCSEFCCQKTYPTNFEDAERLTFGCFLQRTGVDVRNRRCFACDGKLLTAI